MGQKAAAKHVGLGKAVRLPSWEVGRRVSSVQLRLGQGELRSRPPSAALAFQGLRKQVQPPLSPMEFLST
jgi:hypothetical protein